MKKIIEDNKNLIFICTYVVVLLAIVFNFSYVTGFLSTVFHYLRPLFYAILIAFVINIPMCAIEKVLNRVLSNSKILRKYVRIIAILLTIIFVFFVLFLLLLIIIPRVSESILDVIRSFNFLIDSSVKSVDQIFADLNIKFRLQDIEYIKELQKMSWQDIFAQAIKFFGDITTGVISNALAFTNAFFEGFLAFFLSVYLLAGKERFIYQLREVVFAFFNLRVSYKIFEVGERANRISKKFVGGQLVSCATKGILFYFILLLLGYPLPELLATIIALFSIIPVFGPIFAMFVNFILIFAFDPVQAIWFLIIFQVLSNLESQIIYPKIVGKSIGLPGIWILLSIFVLGGMYGVMGMLLAVPVTALVYELFREFIHYRLAKKKISVIESPEEI